MELFTKIRHMISDSRQISQNYDLPLYKVSQLKNRLFLWENSQDEETCEWWLRLLDFKATEDDLKRLKKEMV